MHSMNDSATLTTLGLEPRPLVTVLLPAFNESAILEENVGVLRRYLAGLRDRFRFELLIVNDGSRDDTGEIAEQLAQRHPEIRVLHHPRNFGLGQAFKTGFAHSSGDYVVTLDIDLSYGPEHVTALLDRIVATRSKLVLASPYMKGGRITNVPWLRRQLSIWANRFLGLFAHGNLSTLTAMTRAYDGPFIRALALRATGMEVMPETIYKSMIMRARIEQIPAHLDWSRQIAAGPRRKSSMRIVRHMFATLLSGFIFRPFMFFIAPGLALLAFSLYVNTWMVMHFFDALATVPDGGFSARAAAAVADAYAQYPHTFIVGLLSLMLAVQLVSLGILALQSKSYFEEIFHLGITLRRDNAPKSRIETVPTVASDDRADRRESL
jgi:glycosyltransferase involved in cell wall biosynthesis